MYARACDPGSGEIEVLYRGQLLAAALGGLLLFREPDTFKLAIRGYAFIEEIIDGGIREGLPGGASREIMRLSSRTRVFLAEALGIITPETRRLINELARIRNDFAHGELDELPVEQARELIQPIRAVFDAAPATRPENLDQISAHVWLQTGLGAAAFAARTSITAAAAERTRREAAPEAVLRGTPARAALEQLFAAAEEAGPAPD